MRCVLRLSGWSGKKCREVINIYKNKGRIEKDIVCCK